VVTNEQIEVAISIKIEPAASKAPGVVFTRDAGGNCHFTKRSAEILEQTIRTDAGNEQIWPAIVVEIRDGTSHPNCGQHQTGAFCDVAKLSLPVVRIERQRRSPHF